MVQNLPGTFAFSNFYVFSLHPSVQFIRIIRIIRIIINKNKLLSMIKRILSLPIAHPVYRCTVRHRGLSAFRQRQMKEPAWSFKSTPIVCWSTSLIMRARVDAEIKQNVSEKNGIETDIYRINTSPSFENSSMAKQSRVHIIVRGNPNQARSFLLLGHF